jgi:uncharacterized Zn finger protein
MIGTDVKCKCKYCGSDAIAHTDTVLTSIPPQYNVDCPKCGRIYMLCSEVYNRINEFGLPPGFAELFND